MLYLNSQEVMIMEIKINLPYIRYKTASTLHELYHAMLTGNTDRVKRLAKQLTQLRRARERVAVLEQRR